MVGEWDAYQPETGDADEHGKECGTCSSKGTVEDVQAPMYDEEASHDEEVFPSNGDYLRVVREGTHHLVAEEINHRERKRTEQYVHEHGESYAFPYPAHLSCAYILAAKGR